MIIQKRFFQRAKATITSVAIAWATDTKRCVGERLSVKTNHDWQIWKCVPRMWWRWFNKKIIFVTMWLVINYSSPARWITRKKERERSCSAGNYVVLTDSLRSNGKETPTGGCAGVVRSSYTARISVISIFQILIIYCTHAIKRVFESFVTTSTYVSASSHINLWTN